jgi:DNA-binding transcriptional MerR regulator
MYRIGEFSKLTKTTVKALRYYDETGLLKPEYVDKFTNYRFYTSGQLVKLHRILALRQIGLSIDEIRLIIRGHDAGEIIRRRKKELESEIAESMSQLSRIEFILSRREDEDFMSYQAIIKQLPECIVYSKTTVIPDYNAYFTLIPAIGEALKAKYPTLKCAQPEYCFVRYLDGEYKEKDINIEFCEAVDKIMPDFDDIVFKKLDSVTAVSVMHKGPYSGLSKAYAFIIRWIEENGYAVADSPRESYIDGIWNKDSEDEWLTELQIPVISESGK